MRPARSSVSHMKLRSALWIGPYMSKRGAAGAGWLRTVVSRRVSGAASVFMAGSL
jgi:hypothetical protein